jgi:anti-sigma B factor antagonist
MQLQLELIGREGNVNYLRLGGEVDLSVVPELKERLMEVSFSSVNVDITELSFIDSCGISTLLAVRKVLRREGNDLMLVGASDHVARLFEILGLDFWAAA